MRRVRDLSSHSPSPATPATRRTRQWIALLASVLLGVPLLAQGNPTGRLGGRVTADDGALPGVTVSVGSPNLQGQRIQLTNQNGDYLFAALPPGTYTVTFELDGFEPRTVNARVPALQDTRVDANLSLTTVAETIEVTGESGVISEAATAGASYAAELLETLPLGRDFRDQALLAPGVSATGPQDADGDQAVIISGAMSFENLFTVNGVSVNENVRGQAFDLFIPDAIQEVSTATAGISAEYGRFGGGVVNLLTKSGGNTFSGSLRANLNNQDWRSEPPIANPRTDDIVPTYEATLGGRIVRDRLWFFAAGLGLDEDEGRQTFASGFPYTRSESTRRYEAKLTSAITPSHTVLGSYIKEDKRVDNFDPFNAAMEIAALDSSRETPQELRAINYTGIFSANFYGELQYSEREFTFVDSGGDDGDLIRGTPITDSANSSATYHAPWFCGAPCPDEERDNENLVAKMSAFLSTKSLGSHDIVLGYDSYDDIRKGDNHQSATDFSIGAPGIVRDGTVFPQLIPFVSYVIWWPVATASQGTDFRTNSIFLNDRWQLNDRLSFNLGLRYDENDGVDSRRAEVAKDDNLSPRLGLTWDLGGDDRWQLQASYGKYVTALANTVADSTSPAGTPAIYAWVYDGPEVNADPNAPTLVSADDALRTFFDWFASVGETDNLDYRFFATVPGVNLRIADGGLASPNVDEYTIGVTHQFGARGMLRADYIRREYQDFYYEQKDLTTGRVTDELGRNFDLGILRNSRGDELERLYDAVQLQASWRLSDRLDVAGNYTWSHLRGNVNGEIVGSGPIASRGGHYPEYTNFARNNVRGDLAADARHKARVWAVWRALDTERFDLSVSLLQSYVSGLPYGEAGSVTIRPFVTNPGYVTPPTSVSYWFTGRSAHRTDGILSTDLTAQLELELRAGSKAFSVYLEPEILNLFDHDGAINVNTNVFTNQQDPGLLPFDPFTETPVEGVHYRKGPSFGQPTREIDFQTPRTYKLALGVRF